MCCRVLYNNCVRVSGRRRGERENFLLRRRHRIHSPNSPVFSVHSAHDHHHQIRERVLASSSSSSSESSTINIKYFKWLSSHLESFLLHGRDSGMMCRHPHHDCKSFLPCLRRISSPFTSYLQSYLYIIVASIT